MMKKLFVTVAFCGLLSACSGPTKFSVGDPFSYLRGNTEPQTYAGLASPGQHLVQGGETVYKLAREYNVSPQSIIRANQLERPDILYVGQLLTIPGAVPSQTSPQTVIATASAPVKDTATDASNVTLARASTSPVLTEKQDVEHVVAPGESLDAIARRHGVTRSQVLAANDITDPNHVWVGQKLKVPASTIGTSDAERVTFPVVASGDRERRPAGSNDTIQVASLGEPANSTPSPRETLSPELAKESVQTIAPGQASADVVRSEPSRDVSSLARNDDELEKLRQTAKTPSPPLTGQGFVLPVAGKIVVPFGKQSNGTQNEGVNIATPSNTPVRASESGVVSFADEGLNGYGKMIVIRHSDGYLTAYAHNAVNLVELGDVVERGQVIARVGASGNVAAPQLHFELRRNGKPLDPMEHTARFGQVVANSQ